MLRSAVVLFSILVIAAATHGNVIAAGGYANPSGMLSIALAALLVIAGGYVGVLSSERRWIAASIVVMCLMCGEAYWLFTNADRELAERESRASPVLTLTAARQAAKKRLDDATAAKMAADEAMISEAAKMGCRKNCADLLTRNQDAAVTEQNAARAALTGLPGARSAAALAEHLGIARWAWDLIMAALRSVAVVGASLIISIAAHPAGARERSEPEPATKPPTARKRPRRVQAAETVRPRRLSHHNHVSQFLAATIEPDNAGKASLRELHGRYLAWCRSTDSAPLPSKALGRELVAIVDEIGLETEPTDSGNDVLICGAALR